MSSLVASRRARWWVVIILVLFVVLSLVFRLEMGAGAWGVLLLCFACELLDSSLGMGYGTTLTPVLLACGFEPLALVPSVLFSEFLSGFAASHFHHEAGNVDLSPGGRESRVALLLALGSVVGVVAGVSFAVKLPVFHLKLIIGLIITSAGAVIWILQRRTFTYRTWKMFALAAVASFNKALSGGGIRTADDQRAGAQRHPGQGIGGDHLLRRGLHLPGGGAPVSGPRAGVHALAAGAHGGRGAAEHSLFHQLRPSHQ